MTVTDSEPIPMTHASAGKVASSTCSMVIIRADGTREDIGVVAAAYGNPLRQLWHDLVVAPRTRRRIAAANTRNETR